MDLEHSFTIPAPPDQAWRTLLDVERLAPCMPGATVDSVDDGVINGRIKVKVGPVTLTYTGTAQFTERDDDTRSVTLTASGRETRGSGTASATIRSTLRDEGDQTRVVVATTMNVTGRPAQFGRGVMAEVGGKLIERFAANLAAQLASGAEPAPGIAPGNGNGAGPEASAAGPARPTPITADGAAGESVIADSAMANGGSQAPQAPARDADDAIDLLDVAGIPVLKRVLPAVGAVAVLALALLARRRRRRRRA